MISYGLSDRFLAGQTFAESIEDTYVSFRRRVELMIRNTTCTCRACQAIDEERLAVAKRLEVPSRPFLENFYLAGLTSKEAFESGSIARACEESEPNKTIKSPPSLDHRYVHEDIGYGLVPFAAFGRLAGVPTPAIDAMVLLASVATGIDYSVQGLTLDKMGLDGLNVAELKHFVETGERA